MLPTNRQGRTKNFFEGNLIPMMKPWNLAPEKWSDLLLGSVSPEEAAEDLKRGRLMPWALSLQHLTADIQTVLDLGSGEESILLSLLLVGGKPR
jgi:hypothetical protein